MKRTISNTVTFLRKLHCAVPSTVSGPILKPALLQVLGTSSDPDTRVRMQCFGPKNRLMKRQTEQNKFIDTARTYVCLGRSLRAEQEDVSHSIRYLYCSPSHWKRRCSFDAQWVPSLRQRSENKWISFFCKIDNRSFQINLMNKIYTEISHKKLTYTSKIVQLTVSPPLPTSGQKQIKRRINCNIKLICFAWKE